MAEHFLPRSDMLFTIMDSSTPKLQTSSVQIGSPAQGSGLARNTVDTSRVNKMKDAVRKAKIMIIDDEQLVIKVVKRYLTAEGYINFVTVNDSRQAVKRIWEEQPDVILSDINMPHVSGLDILRVRQRSQELSSIPVLILSASSEQDLSLIHI